MNIPGILEQQHVFFNSRITRDIRFRKAALNRLRQEILKREKEITEAMYQDFRKSEFESAILEIGIVLTELNFAIRRIRRWTRPRKVLSALVNFPSSSFIYKEPFGTVLILAPWNYPFLLVFTPLIGAVAAGNTVVLKPSELTTHTSRIVAKLIAEVFDPGHVTVVEGDSTVAASLMNEKWDYVFLTGSSSTGKRVAEAAARTLTPCTLELGGKSPCLVDETADIPLAARRIVWGKFINTGQSCIAPDFVLIHEKVKETFVKECIRCIHRSYGENIRQSPDFPRIISNRNFKSLLSMLEGQKILFGGDTDEADLYISPTLVDHPPMDSPIMKEEIFGPLLPIIGYKDEKEMLEVLDRYKDPLAFYVFSRSRKKSKKLFHEFSFGGAVWNDTMVHFGETRLPFGGIGHSGMGKYHGKHTFNTFSSSKGVAHRATWLDIPFRYPPYTKKVGLMKLFQKIFG